MRKAFSPSARASELGTTNDNIRDCLKKLRRRYDAKNTRNLVYMLYKRKASRKANFVATKACIEIMSLISQGETYKNIAAKMEISHSGVCKYLEKLLYDNKCQNINELLILYWDWEFNTK